MTTFRIATRTDLDALTRLFVEMQALYVPELSLDAGQVAPTVDAALFGPNAFAEALVAMRDEEFAGFAIFTRVFPARGIGTSVPLKDLFVSAPSRRSGVCEALMRALAMLCLDRGYVRLELATGTDNPGARAFYAKLGLPVHEHVAYRLEVDAPRRLAGIGI